MSEQSTSDKTKTIVIGADEIEKIEKRLATDRCDREHTVVMDGKTFEASCEVDKTIAMSDQDFSQTAPISGEHTSALLRKRQKSSKGASFFSMTGGFTRTLFSHKRTLVDMSVHASVDSERRIAIGAQHSVETSEHLNLGELEKNYKVGKVFAEGGQGTIALAEDRSLRRLVALKSLKPEMIADERTRGNFISEARVTAQLEHPSIVPVYTLNTDEKNGLHLAMKCVNGCTLSEYLERICKLYQTNGIEHYDERRSLLYRLDVFLHVCDAMAYAHHRNVLHCDLKPDNIMLGKYRETYVMDWGLARAPRTGSNREKRIYGTPRFMPPEIIRCENPDNRSDIYTLGLILYEIVCLKPAFPGESNTQVLIKVRDGAMDPITHRFGVPVDRDLAAIIRKASSYKREDRYQRVQSLANDVRRYLNGDATHAAPDRFWRHFARKARQNTAAMLIISVLALLAGASAIAFMLYNRIQLDSRNHRREQVINMAYAECVSEANDLELQTARLSDLLDMLSETVSMRLAEAGGSHAALPCPTSVFDNKRTAPASAAYFAQYGTNIDLTRGCYKLLPGMTLEDHLPTLRKLAPVQTLMKKILRASGGDGRLQNWVRLLDEGALPVRWIYFALENGLFMSYPARGGYAENYDPRTRPWYRLGRTSERPLWGLPYLDVGDMRDVVISCSRQIRDDRGKVVGVGALDMSLANFRRSMGRNWSDADVISRMVLDEHGKIIFDASRLRGRAQWLLNEKDGDFALMKFPDAALFATIRYGRYGSALRKERGRDVLYVYSYIPSLRWFYVAKYNMQFLQMRMNGRLSKLSMHGKGKV